MFNYWFDGLTALAAITTVFRTDQAPAEKIARDLLDWAVSF